MNERRVRPVRRFRHALRSWLRSGPTPCIAEAGCRPAPDPRQFIRLALAFEGGLAVLSLILGWLANVDPLQHFVFDARGAMLGLAGTVPLALVFLAFYRFPIGALLPIKRFLIETLGPYLNACRWYELLAVASAAGICEELLFRGLLQPWMAAAWGPGGGLIGSNIVFGVLHFITPLYAFVAGLIGVYLGLLLDAGGQRSLLAPMISHAAYDFFAFLVVARTFRNERARSQG